MRTWLASKYKKHIQPWCLKGKDFAADQTEGRAWVPFVAAGIALYFILALAVGVYWSSEPEPFSVSENTALWVHTQADEQSPNITGVATTATLIRVANTLLDKPGGYLLNDVTPPGVWLDNIPNWEYGVLRQVTDLTRVLLESFSRSQTQSLADDALVTAKGQFNFKHDSWILPATEDEYRRGIDALEEYLKRLADTQEQNAQFYARADNLRYWLGSVEAQLGDLSQQLSASVGQRRVNTDLAGDAAATQATPVPGELEVKTPWGKIDDVFYRSRGSAWALLHFLKAIEVDFAEVLENKNATVSLRQIIRELEGTQQSLYSPLILNGSGFGMLANHSLVMANYISRANAAIIDLRELLSTG